MENSLGKTLVAAREAASITIDDAVYLAKIPRDVVIALEAENFGFFSSPLYARSFLKQYGQYVGADVEPWLDDLVPISLIDGQSPESYIDISDPFPTEKPKQKSRAASPSSGGPMAAVWMILITAALIYGGIKAFQAIENTIDQSEETADLPSETEELENQEPTATAPTPPNIPSETPDDKPPLAQPIPEPSRRAIIIEE